MKGFDYAKTVSRRVRPCAPLRWFVPVRQSLRGAYELGVSAAALHNWVRQDRIDREEIPGLTSRLERRQSSVVECRKLHPEYQIGTAEGLVSSSFLLLSGRFRPLL